MKSRNWSLAAVVMIAILAGVVAYATAGKAETPGVGPVKPSVCRVGPDGKIVCAVPPAPRVTSVSRREFEALRARVDKLEMDVRLLKAKVAVRDEEGGDVQGGKKQGRP